MRALAGSVLGLVLIVSGVAEAKPLPNVCRVITEAQVGKALGIDIAYKKPIGTSGCSWTAVPSSSFGTSSASVDATVAPMSPARLAKLKKTERGHGRLVLNLGEWAYWDETLPGGGALFVVKNDYIVQVEAFGVGDPLATAKAIALTALAHL